MRRLSIVFDTPETFRFIGDKVAAHYEVEAIPRAEVAAAQSDKHVIIDIDLSNPSGFEAIRLWLKQRAKGAIAIVVVDEGNRHQAAQAYALGATDLLPRPIDVNLLLEKLGGARTSLAAASASCTAADGKGVSAAVDALQSIFAAAGLGTNLDRDRLGAAGDRVVTQIEADGLVQWVDIVRQHHSQTYQHCLLVTGVATTFGQCLGFSKADQRRLAFAGLLHDIGKARIPIEILEKPGPLDEDEMEIVRQHPLFGFEALISVDWLEPEMLDVVLHHHEYLDGSGYPHGLRGNEISDLVRIMTIADIFGALIERRSYKPPLSGEAAYRVLNDMGGKLDADLVREFAPLSRIQAGAALPAVTA